MKHDPFSAGYLNSEYIDHLFQDYLNNPHSVNSAWRAYFDALEPPKLLPAQSVSGDHERKQMQVLQLVNAYRLQGYLHAQTNPLGPQVLPDISQTELNLESHGLNKEDLSTLFEIQTAMGAKTISLQALNEWLIKTYCGPIGAEFMHIPVLKEREWIQFRIESISNNRALDAHIKKSILTQLTIAEGLEQYLGAKFPGAKRFSLEGGEALLVCLDNLIQRSSAKGVREMVIGMAHRGRLNVLVNTLGKSPQVLFEEFEGKKPIDLPSGDVKYHQGFSSDIHIDGQTLHVTLAFNPSHLEIVTPVVLGSVLARQKRFKDTDDNKVIPIAIHGDAAFAGQGVVMETLNMSQTRAYKVGGTLHIIINNQIGFTTSHTSDARSTLYCSDVAKLVLAPIFHVNADDPEAVYQVTQLALDYRMQFNKDVIIDLVCYRRHGHNEADEPRATQPLMYQFIQKHPSVRTLYAQKLVKEAFLTENEVKALVSQNRDNLDQGKRTSQYEISDLKSQYSAYWAPYRETSAVPLVLTGLNPSDFEAIAQKLVHVPADFVLHPRVDKIMQDRQKMAKGALKADWGFAEMMAYASLIAQGYSLRLTGQDVRRGTFFHRHATLHDQKTGHIYNALQALAQEEGAGGAQVYDSLLSEEAVVAFEYGYATTDPTTLVVWEAQFGDFVNGAQVVIDQFISSGAQKWGRLCGLVMLLPHGYEGQGPEHSSARLERFLQLCAEENLQVCVPTTAAQVFHMLRRQALQTTRYPLIVMSPKSLLRHKDVACDISELMKGSFECLIDEKAPLKESEVKKVILCSGKVYYDLIAQRIKNQIFNLPIIRLEQLYPFPNTELKQALKRYLNATQVVWCQEEPQNQGAWYACQPLIKACLEGHQTLEYIGRAPSAAPAVGHYQTHLSQQEALLNQAVAL